MNAEQLYNCRNLYRVAEKIIREQLPFGFGTYDCGAYACWSGWYGREYGVSSSAAMIEYKTLFGLNWEREASPMMGQQRLGCGPADKPGSEAYAELARRMTILAGIIAREEAKIHTAIPESVLSIFKGEAA